MQYAIIQTCGKQYKVTEGQTLKLEKLPAKKDQKLTFDQVLMLFDEQKTQIGTPYLKKVTVTAALLDQLKHKKIRVAKFRAKSRYRKVTGHRQPYSLVKIEKIKTAS